MMHNGACINLTTHEADHANYTCFSDISLSEPNTFHPIHLSKWNPSLGRHGVRGWFMIKLPKSHLT